MSKIVLLSLKDDNQVYLVDVAARTVEAVRGYGSTAIKASGVESYQNVDIAIAAETRPAASSFPMFIDP